MKYRQNAYTIPVYNDWITDGTTTATGSTTTFRLDGTLTPVAAAPETPLEWLSREVEAVCALARAS